MRLILLLVLYILIQQNGFTQDAAWLRYPAISPDGRFIVFSYQGHLFKVSAEGGRAVQLTSNNAYNFKPVISNDGSKIAYASDRSGNFDIYVMSSEGGHSERLTYHSANDYPSCFSNDGNEIFFYSSRTDAQEASIFPSGVMSELYKVSTTKGGREIQVLTTPAENARIHPNKNILIYEDVKGYENQWRKHHISSVTRDIFIYDFSEGTHTKVSGYIGENRNPVWGDTDEFYYLSEESGHFNIWKGFGNGRQPVQLTSFDNHPVRFLTRSNNGKLCFSWHGDIYTLEEGKTPVRLNIQVYTDSPASETKIQPVSSGASEMALSPNGKEIAFIYKGEVFVTSVEHNRTKRITNTVEEERNISFSPDGKALLYAAERDGIWGIYETRLVREEEKYFHLSTLLDEKVLIKGDKDAFQPSYSPDGKEIAYLENRVILKIYNIESKKSRVILDERHNFSYSDGDQHYDWSPDSKWLLVHYQGAGSMSTEVGLISATGDQPIVNLTKSGYSDSNPKWMSKGNMMIWFSDRNGYRSHGSWGAHSDVYAMFFNKGAFDKFKLKKEELAFLKESEKEKKDEDKDTDTEESKPDKKSKKSSKDGDKEKDKKPKVEDITIDLNGIEDRIARLTRHSSSVSDAVLSNDGEILYYLTPFESGFDLWQHKLYENETKLLSKLNKGWGKLIPDNEGKNLYVLASGQILKISTDKGESKPVSFSTEMVVKSSEEREYIFEHVWRQFRDKFYLVDIHGTDWDFYKKEYLRFLPYINNNYDFAELLSEMLGEANASHTGSGYRNYNPLGDQTAALGLFYDTNYTGDGLLISEVINKSPVLKDNSKIKKGVIIEKIDGETIPAGSNYYRLLNRKTDVPTLLSLYDPKSKDRWEEVVKPISLGTENNLLYERWVKQRRQIVDSLSNGKLGYVHVRGMNSGSFRDVFSDVLGKYHDKDALIVDTRFNGGGWLHDDLATFLSGKRYLTFSPRGNEILGGDPMSKWTKPSCVLVSESNYSDAHMFPYVYKTLEIGKLIGMPVPGTATAVWWETLRVDPTLYYGIPQLGIRDLNDNFLENQQLDPDILIWNDYESMSKGEDLQLLKAIEEMMK